jgi:hypothetical protein
MSDVVIQIATQSQIMYYNSMPAPQPPVITINNTPIPSPGTPGSATGYQLVLLNSAADYTNPANILANTYIGLFPEGGTNNWMGTYQYLYSSMIFQLLSAGNVDLQLMILASYGLDNNMPPTNDGYGALLDFGAGPRLQYWETHCDAGSQVGNPNSWVSIPANYLFVGFQSNGYGQGWEVYDVAGQNPSISSKLSVTLQNPVPPSKTK